MKKLLKANATLNILTLILTFGISLLIAIVPVALHSPTNRSEIMKISIPLAIFFFIGFWLVIFYTLSKELKIKNDIIRKFSLKENEFTPVLVSDSLLFPFESSILVDAIKLMTNGTFNFIEASIDIENGTLALPYDNITPACYTLVKIFKELGGNFYLSLDNNYNIFLVLKDKDNELLSTTKLNSKETFNGVFYGFSIIDAED